MTRADIKEQAGAHAAWMAAEALREACKAVNRKNDNVHEYNREGLEATAEVLFTLFYTCTAVIKTALISTARKLDGFYGSRSTYLDTFLAALAETQGDIQLRQSDWVLES